MDDEICVLNACETKNPGFQDEWTTETEMDNHVITVPETDYDADTDQVVVNKDDKAADSINKGNSEYVDDSKSGMVTSLVVVSDSTKASDPHEANGPKNSSDISYETSFSAVHEGMLSRLEEAETLNAKMESRVYTFEKKFTDLQKRMDEVLDSNGNLLSSIEKDLQTRADETELKQLKKDFDQFSKRLKRVVQAEDSVNAESLDATKVPPDVLEITYAKTLNDIYSAMLGVYGDREAAEMVEDARDSVRQFSAGIDFFRFEDDSFIIRGLSEAISSKIVSIKQIHGTYIELFKMLFQYVPNYNSQDFRSFVETGSREYTIEKVVSHEGYIDKINSDIGLFRDELANITENVSFMAELQNNQLEETASNSQDLTEIKEQMKGIAKAVNLHTKAINKLSTILSEFRNSSITENPISESIEVPDLSRIEEMVVSKASQEDIIAISCEMESFKASVENMFSSIQQQVQETMLNSQKLQGTEDEISEVHEEIPDRYGIEEPRPLKLSEMPIEDVITGQLSVLGSATLKQLEKQIQENGFSIDFEKLVLVMSYLEQEQLVHSTKKGRYTFYSVAVHVNV
ncbi:hypothetical protein [uncultured Methanolobus sp.]|uniref:hypothetical protein n=1 Tax=uncultured Methanolobus sp. TaxID=218300 RepID=UPI0029C668BA|nr:hypothetical protein [uncultured Methanolobus sp.]